MFEITIFAEYIQPSMPGQKMERNRERIVGSWYAVGAFSLWGILPLYWKALKSVPASQIIAHRILWSFIIVVILLFMQHRMQELKQAVSSWRYRLYFLLSAVTLGTNWFIYIWAVNAGHIVETSMGYFINPLLNVLLGMLLLRERLSFWQAVSVALAFAGVLYMTLQYGKVPWIALSLAFSFAFYGLLRKTSHAGSLIGLLIETIILSPAALTFIMLKQMDGTGALGSVSVVSHIMLVCAGLVTATPLLWFAHGARRIPLSTVGFIQYLAPSLQLIIGVVVFKESFTPVHVVSFSLIWGALCIYSFSNTGLMQSFAPISKRIHNH